MKYKYITLSQLQGSYRNKGKGGNTASPWEGAAYWAPDCLPIGSAAQNKPGLGEKAASLWASRASSQPLGIHKKEQQLACCFRDST